MACSRAAFASFVAYSILRDGRSIRLEDIRRQCELSERLRTKKSLSNILRASKGQTPNFVGISQITGSQTETLTTGLPTINLGPHSDWLHSRFTRLQIILAAPSMAAIKRAHLISTSFQELMLFPINFKQLALLLVSNPRELVFHATIDGLVLSRAGRQVLYRNNPTANENGRYEPPDKNADGSVIDCRAVLADDRFEWNMAPDVQSSSQL